MTEFPKAYVYAQVEQEVAEYWNEHHSARPAVRSDGSPEQRDAKRGAMGIPYSMVIPPPNVTGRLHMGHALNNTLQDLIIRYKRMCGYDALWVPGTDHAGIATQTVVKKMLDAQGIDYRNIGREAFIKHVFAWKEKYGGHIFQQIRQLGCSCDWDRVRFTMDETLVEAVNTAFVRLYRDGLIYKGERIVNWCPVDRTALADDEVETSPQGEEGFLYELLYPFAEEETSLKGLIVATTRPETLFGDMAVAVHPEDKRYSAFIGKKVRLPLTDRTIPIIADPYVDMKFGTGCLKITPGHDKNDFEIGKRHGLPVLTVMNEDATMNDEVPKDFQGYTREDCREKVIAHLREANYLIRQVPHRVPVGRSYRSKAIIEYRVSDQWFVRMEPLAKALLQAPERFEIHPKRLEKYYESWLTNIQDWCISRQIWWGHRIPAWVHAESGAIRVGLSEVDALKDLPEAERGAWQQEKDVLDTWFSSALWPLSTMGWPNEDAFDFKRYFPTATLSTAKDIIFFWVARMALLSWHFTKKMPFKDVYIHPTILDAHGRTMSKSKGNGIDPQHIINGASVEEMKQPVLDARPADLEELIGEIEEKYAAGFPGVGADALRYTLLYLLTSAQAVQLSLQDFINIGRRFTTKFWNAARMLFLNMEKLAPFSDAERLSLEQYIASEGTNFSDHTRGGDGGKQRIEDRWIEIECFATMKSIERAHSEFDFSNLGECYYKLVWTNFCDHYLEIIKIRLAPSDDQGTDENEESLRRQERLIALRALTRTFRHILILLHPLIPFMTEYMWQQLSHALVKKEALPLMEHPALTEKDFPELGPHSEACEQVEQRFVSLKRIISKVRAIRKRYRIHENVLLRFTFEETPSSDFYDFILAEKALLANWMHLSIVPAFTSPEQERALVIYDEVGVFYIDLSNDVDWGYERERLEKEKAKLDKQLTNIRRRLEHQGFLKKARAELVQTEREKEKHLTEALRELGTELAALDKRMVGAYESEPKAQEAAMSMMREFSSAYEAEHEDEDEAKVMKAGMGIEADEDGGDSRRKI